MTDTDPVIQRVHHRIDETNKDLHELELKVEGHNTILHKKNGQLGLVAEVAINTSFRKQIANDIRKMLFMFIGQGIVILIAVVIWAIQNM